MRSNYQPLEYILQGNKESKSIIVFLQGWPDNHQVWEPLESSKTLEENRILYINFPNTSKTQEQIKWGQDFPEIVERMKATFDAVNLSKFQKKVMVAHDWGCIYFYAFDKKYPGIFNDIIALDVPAYAQKFPSLSAFLMILTYQFILILAFLVGGTPGKLICKGVSKFFKHTPKYFDELSGARCYPYFYYYKNMIQGLFNKEKRLLYKYLPSAPVVYVYGKKKPFQFGGEKWTNFLLEHERSQIHGLDCGHWIMNKYSTFLVDLIKRRIKAIAK